MRRFILSLLVFQLMLMSNSVSAQELPENFREEEVQGALPEGIDRSQCHRYIGSGNFWGDSAVDVCCSEEEVSYGDETVRHSYTRCFIRRPTSSNSSETWTQVKFPVNTEIEPAESSSLFEGLLFEDFASLALFPSAYAITDEMLEGRYEEPEEPIPGPEWTAPEREVASVILAQVANQMAQAYANNLTDEIGVPGSDFRRYADLTYAAALWGFGYLTNVARDDYCPAEMPACCFDTDDLDLTWADVRDVLRNRVPEETVELIFHSATGVTARVVLIALRTLMHGHPLLAVLTEILVHVGVEVGAHGEIGRWIYDSEIQIPSIYKIDQYPQLQGMAVIHLAMGLSKFVFDESRSPSSSVRSDIFNTDRPVNYGDDTTALIVGSIVHHFLFETVRLESERAGADTAILLRLYNTLQQDPTGSAARLAAANELGGTTINSGLTLRQQIETALQTTSVGVSVEVIFQRAGGLYAYMGQVAERCSPSGCSSFDTAHPDNLHNEVESPSCDSGCENSEDPACQPPDCEANPEACMDEPEPAGEEPPDPTEVPGCVTYYDEWILEGRTVPRSCYDDCWANFPGYTNNNLCDPVKRDDLENNCSLSGGAACRAQLPAYCGANPTGLPCTDLCRTHADWTQCDTACNRDRSLPFCLDRCEDFSHEPDYCRQFCRDSDTNLRRDFCRDSCQAAAGSGSLSSLDHCDDYCARVSWNQDFCRNICATEPGHRFCLDLCNDGGFEAGQSYCLLNCEMSGSTLYCCGSDDCCQRTVSGGGTIETRCCAIDTCGRVEAPPPPTSGGSGCPSGWTYRQGSVEVSDDGCFPFVGNIKCCGSDCEPDGPNEACTEEGWCGCDPDRNEARSFNRCLWPSSGGWDETMRINPNGSSDSDDFCTNGVGVICSRSYGYDGECGCVGACVPIHCYPYIVPMPPGSPQPFYAGQCCDEGDAANPYPRGRAVCVPRSSLGLPP